MNIQLLYLLHSNIIIHPSPARYKVAFDLTLRAQLCCDIGESILLQFIVHHHHNFNRSSSRLFYRLVLRRELFPSLCRCCPRLLNSVHWHLIAIQSIGGILSERGKFTTFRLATFRPLQTSTYDYLQMVSSAVLTCVDELFWIFILLSQKLPTLRSITTKPLISQKVARGVCWCYFCWIIC